MGGQRANPVLLPVTPLGSAVQLLQARPSPRVEAERDDMVIVASRFRDAVIAVQVTPAVEMALCR